MISSTNLHGYGDPHTVSDTGTKEEEHLEKEHEEEEEEEEAKEDHLEEEDDDEDEESDLRDGGSLLDLPTDCLVRIISFLPPKEVCRVSSLCKALRYVADSDDVWADKVPIYPRSVTEKKQAYFHLRSGVLQRWWSDPAISQGCFLMPAKHLHITWGDDLRYWHWLQQSESWFGEAAHLVDVCWLEISGNICETIFRPGVYVVSFRIMLRNLTGFWRSPIKLCLSTSDGQHTESERFFQGDQTRCKTVAPLRSVGDQWLELDVGKFSVDEEMPLTVKFSLMEIEGGAWKRGLIVDCVKIQSFDHISGTFIQ